MKTKLAILIITIVFSAFYTSVSAQNYRTPAYPSYDYRYHAYQNYERAAERYMSNPTRHNYQVMEQRRQIWEMRERQYQQYKK